MIGGREMFAMRSTRRAISLVGLVVAGLMLLAGCGASGGERGAATSSELPVARIEAFAQVPADPVALAESGAVVVHARLVEVVDGYEYRGGPEDVANGFVEEKLGLRFEVLDTFMGIDPGPKVTVEVTGYQADPQTKRRLRRVVTNGVDPAAEWVVGNEYVFSMTPLEDHYWFNAYDLVAQVGPGGELQPIADPPPEGYRSILNVADARKVFTAAGAQAGVEPD